MQRFSNKKPSEVRTRTYVLPARMRGAGITVASINAVSASVYDFSPVTDGNPSAILSGSPQIVATPFTAGLQQVGANQAIIQNITGGVINCVYVITWDLALSTGERFIEDTLQLVTEYVPA